MNIKQHIEAGHYPVDPKGRALVPMGDGGVATIVATDAPGGQACPILGWDNGAYRWWNRAGTPAERGWADLLPPPPRKVEVKRWAVISRRDGGIASLLDTKQDPGRWDAATWVIVELTGSYEVQE